MLKRYSSSLKTRILLWVLLLVLAAIWGLAARVSAVLRNDLEQVVTDHLSATVGYVVNDLDNKIQLRIDTLREVAASITPEMLADPNKLNRMLEQRNVSHRLFPIGIFVANRQGINIAEYPRVEGRLGGSVADRDYFRGVMAGGELVVGKPIQGRFWQQSIAALALPLRDASGATAGVLIGAMILSDPELFGQLEQTQVGKTGFFLVYSPTERLIVSATDKRRILTPLPPRGVNPVVDQRIDAGVESALTGVNSQGIENLSVARKLKTTGWITIAGIAAEEAFAPINNLKRQIYLAALAISLALALVLRHVLVRQLAPLAEASDAMRLMTCGDKAFAALPVRRNDEIGQMVDNFNRLVAERNRADQDLRVAATAFEAQEGMFVTDAGNVILRVNQAFTEITGYTAAEAIGKTPSLLNSGRHDKAFYAQMWESLGHHGTWQGEVWNRRKNGEVYPEWLTVTAVKGASGDVSHYVATLTDITHRKAAEDQIKNLAFYDPLTRLPNRRLALDRLQQALTASSRHNRHGALMLLDMDDFKTLNDTLGHDVGDKFLVEVANRLQACVREGDTVARQGGDEFVVILEDLNKDALAAMQAESIAVKIQRTVNQPYLLDLTLPGGKRSTRSYHCTSSIGITLFRDNSISVDELMKRADTAMYQAKAAGRDALRFFDPEMQAAVTARADLDNDLREALRDNQFLLYYQPQVDDRGRMTGAEALVRWHHPRRGLMSPGEFIALAEETGLILPLGHWVMETACSQLVAWASRPDFAHLTVAVNVSARQFRHPDFVDQVLALLENTGADPQKLKLELTESLLLDDVEDTVAKMTALKATGVGFSLDDFGTGYSSLSYLKRLPLDQLKIDQSFVRDILTDPNDAAIARTIVALAQSMGLAVIAEGVETEEQRDFLVRERCHAFQGYLFGRPMPAAEFGLSAAFISGCAADAA